MIESKLLGEEGFLYPELVSSCIHCGNCFNSCPVLSPNYNRCKKPEVYSIRCSNTYLECSSGGVFGKVARAFLGKG